MVRLLVNWERGQVHLNASRTDTVRKILELVAEKLGCNPSDIALLAEFNSAAPLDHSVKFKDFAPPGTQQATLYLKVLKPFSPNIGCDAAPAVAANRFLAPGETPTLEMQRIAAEFGDRAVSLAHYAHADSLKPRIEEQAQSSCYAIRISEKIFLTFEALALQDGFRVHRFAFLYGRVKPLTGKVTVHCCFEPEQVSSPERVDLHQSFNIDIPNAIAAQFGMQCVGMAVSGSFDAKMPLHPYVIVRAAQYQNLFGEYFVTLIVSPSQGSEGRVSVEAFQVKDVAMRLEKEGLVVPSADPSILKFKEPIFVYGKGKKLDQLQGDEVNLLLCAVRVRQKESKIPLHVFPAPAHSPSFLDLKRHLENHEFCPSWYKLFDFNLLVFLATKGGLAVTSEIQVIIRSIIAKTDVPEGIMELIDRKVNAGKPR
jgi:hypothetical protein